MQTSIVDIRLYARWTLQLPARPVWTCINLPSRNADVRVWTPKRARSADGRHACTEADS